MLVSTGLFALLLHAVSAAPSSGMGIRWDKRSSLPQVTFEDATYQATKYNADADIYTFSNVRYAAPPLGELRWAKPAPPAKNPVIQDGSYGNACPNAQINGLNFVGPISDLGLGSFVDWLINKVADLVENQRGNEDCLFLDIYVPGAAVRDPSSNKLPVMHYFFGGGFVLGSKTFLEPLLPWYDGTGFVQKSNNSIIFISSNYRLGAFGWLGGTTMEEEGLPNAGLWDQRAALQWTKDNIGQLGGDGSDVTAMGESAGASSILHHLVLEGGTLDPLFRKAIALSPAYFPLYDRAGSIEDGFRRFTQLAGCSESTVACLRAADTQTLITANQRLNADAPDGTFVLGPVPDGKTIRQSPTLEYASGNYWKSLDGAIISHVADEATLFVDGHVSTEADFDKFVEALFSPAILTDGLDQYIFNEYPPPGSPNSSFGTQGDRLRTTVRDACFTCNARYLSEAYKGRSWQMQYSVFPGWHATDCLAAFWNDQLAETVIGKGMNLVLHNLAGISATYLSYIVSFVKTSDPNALSNKSNNPPAINWPHPDFSQPNPQSVLSIDQQLSLIEDMQMPQDKCQFWIDFMAGATAVGGYAPPDAYVHSPFAQVSPEEASARYASGGRNATLRL